MEFTEKDIRKLKKKAKERLLSSAEERIVIGGIEHWNSRVCFTCERILDTDYELYDHAVVLGHNTYPRYTP